MSITHRQRWIFRGLATGCLIAGLFLAARSVPPHDVVELVTTRIEELGLLGPLCMAALWPLSSLLLIPVWPLTLIAGGIFGFPAGSIIAWFGSIASCSISFLITRYLARDVVEERIRSIHWFYALDRAVVEHDWKVVVLARMSFVFPFHTLNYTFGLTGVGFWRFLIASAVVSIPGTTLYGYLGHLGVEGLEEVARPAGSGDLLRWIGAAAAVAVVLVLLAFLGYQAKEAMKKYVPEALVEPPPPDEPVPAVRPVLGLIFGIAVFAGGLWCYTNPDHVYRFLQQHVGQVERP